MKMPLTKKEAAVIEAYTGVAMLVEDDRKYLYDYLSEVVGIPIYTHEIPHVVDVYKDEVKRDFVEICKSISDADVQEVKHAEWKINCDGYYPYCSNCKQEPHGREMSQYCPHCGCIMDGEENAKTNLRKP